MVHYVNHLPCKLEDMRLIPSNNVKVQVWWLTLVIPALERWRQKVLKFTDQWAVHNLEVPGPSERHCLKTPKALGNGTQHQLPASIHMPTHTQNCIHIQKTFMHLYNTKIFNFGESRDQVIVTYSNEGPIPPTSRKHKIVVTLGIS